jgi:cell division protein FtsQ
VANAQVYTDNARTLHVQITQRVPVARIFDQAGNSYYLDNTLKSMPLSDRYVHYTTVVTNVPVFTSDSMDMVFKAKVVALVRYIDRDSFWNAQVSQIMVTDSMDFELMPVLGNHKIVFGDTTQMQDKFKNLFAFYKKVLNRVGWDKYEVLDVRYEKQVVASPALQWKVPVDKAAVNMSWVKSIIDNDTNDVAQPDMSTAPVTNNVTIINASSVPLKIAEPVAEHKVPESKVVQKVPTTKPTPIVKKLTPVAKKQERVVQAKSKPVVKNKTVKRDVNKEMKKESQSEQPQGKYIYKGE